MWLLAIGIVFALLGVAGIVAAPAMVEAQRKQGMVPVASDEIDDDDRIAVTKGVGIVFATVGVVLVVYALV
ncbi:hypothetical protein [Halovivax gelatinilyticus]|uniref:hypothetical protein n=1 Tax=Halovivax gelatinilyticus TaxID=2961597 RepID=UPI0020CA472D|nr:hypothetical protein [Halovivax gelatinilyticus]